MLEISEKIESEQVKALIEGMRSQLASPSDQIIADFFGVNRSTCQRWKRGTTKIRDTDLLIRKLGCTKDVFEQMTQRKMEVAQFLQIHTPLWQSHMSDYGEVNRFVNEILPRTNMANVVKVLQVATEIVANHVLRQVDK